MEYVTVNELQSSLTTTRHAYDLKVLWHNVNVAAHDLKDHIDKLQIFIDDVAYSAFDETPDIVPRKKEIVIVAKFDNTYHMTHSVYLNQAVNRHLSVAFVRALYKKFHAEWKESKCRETIGAIRAYVDDLWTVSITTGELVNILRHAIRHRMNDHQVGIYAGRIRGTEIEIISAHVDGKKLSTLRPWAHGSFAPELRFNIDYVYMLIEKLVRKTR